MNALHDRVSMTTIEEINVYKGDAISFNSDLLEASKALVIFHLVRRSFNIVIQ